MSTFQTTQNVLRQVYILDVLGIARMLESALADFNLLPYPPSALYLPNKVGPVLLEGVNYWYEVVEQVATGPYNNFTDHRITPEYRYNYAPVVSIHDVVNFPWDIVDRNDGSGSLVVNHREFHQLSRNPYLPQHGLQLVNEVIIDETLASRAFETKLRVRSIEELATIFPAFQGMSISALRDDTRYVEMFTYLWDLLDPVRKQIRDFLHGQPYAICSVDKINAFTFQIGIKGDQRILEWEQHKASGKW